jgi:LDH2 family malate/lactate/ureidoglycolate dehydrogenase
MVTVSDRELKRFIVDVLERRGMARIDADKVASALMWANMRGVDSHGVARLPRYLEMIDQNVMNVRPVISTEVRSPAAISIDADYAPGPVAMEHALKSVIGCATKQGIGLALISRMTHSGALGYYTLKAAEAGMACIALNATIPLMPYHGATGAAVGTNPISFAVPAGEGADALVFDMAASVASLGKLFQARRAGTPLRPGSFVDDAGRSTTDPAAARMPLPLGGPKGAGLSLMIECVASLLSGAPILADALTKSGEGARHRQNAVLIAIDISRFIDLGIFRAEVVRLVGTLKALPLAPDAEIILMPGERGFRTMAERRAKGIPLPPGLQTEMMAIAQRLKIPDLQLVS